MKEKEEENKKKEEEDNNGNGKGFLRDLSYPFSVTSPMVHTHSFITDAV